MATGRIRDQTAEGRVQPWMVNILRYWSTPPLTTMKTTALYKEFLVKIHFLDLGPSCYTANHWDTVLQSWVSFFVFVLYLIFYIFFWPI